MAIFTTILNTILTPIAGKLITSYLEPKLKPVIEGVGTIERKYKNLSNDDKHDKLLRFIEDTPSIMKFVYKRGWNEDQLNIFIKFCVLIAKKPPYSEDNDKERWNKDDIKVAFDFLWLVGQNLIKRFR